MQCLIKACLSLITNETNAQHWLPRDFKQECADHASSYPLSSGMCRRPSFSFSLGPNPSIPFDTYTDSTIDCMRASAVEEQQPLLDIEAHRFLVRDLLQLAASVLWPRIQLAPEKSPKALMHDGPRFPLSLCCFAAQLLFTLMDVNVNVKFLWSSGSRSMSQRTMISATWGYLLVGAVRWMSPSECKAGPKPRLLVSQ